MLRLGSQMVSSFATSGLQTVLVINAEGELNQCSVLTLDPSLQSI